MMQLLRDSADEFEQAVVALQPHFSAPAWIDLRGGVHGFRHESRDDLLMSFLKCVRCVSILRAGISLLEDGCHQEVGILCRCISESVEDVLFLATPLGDNDALSEHQVQLVEEFFQEEFDDPKKPVGSQAQRNRLPRDQVLAGIARIPGNPLNPSDGKAFARTLHMGFSGYVHGAYPHIMELYSAKPDAKGQPDVTNGRFAMSGKMPEQRLHEMVYALGSRALNMAVAVCIVAKRVNNKAVEDRLRPVLDALSKATGSNVGDPNKAAKAVKAGKPLD